MLLSSMIILVCGFGTDPVECNIQTAIEVGANKNVAVTECVYGAMPTIAVDPRASNQVYSKVICSGR